MKKYDFNFLTGNVVTKQDEKYDEATLHWNRAIEKRPLAFVFCQNVADVKNAIQWCKENNLIFKIRSGRHHYEGLSTGDDIIVIDVSGLNKIEINEEQNTVSIQGGVRNRELYEALGEKGYPFPGGGCPTVGVAGFTIGGGWGYSSRLFGLGCDNLIEIEVIDYKGDTLIANATQNIDLFWALRGSGGQNFGIAVRLTYKLPPKLNQGCLINFDYLQLDKTKITDLVLTYQDYFKTLDRRMNLKIGIYNSAQKGQGVRITGLFYGNKAEAIDNLKPLIQFVDDKTIFTIDEMSILEANREIQDSHPDYENYKSSGRFMMRDLTEDDIKMFLELIENRAQGAYYTAVSLYGMGGAVADVEVDATSFYYREARFILGFQSVWEDNSFAPANVEWFLSKFEHLKAITQGAFINFPLTEMDNYMEEYYGKNAKRLQQVREIYDPFKVFDFEQGIQ
ncbi:MAG: FAD-binding protein [Turicibacter sp.]